MNITTQTSINTINQKTTPRHFNPQSVSLPTSGSTKISAALSLLPDLIRSFSNISGRNTITGDNDHNELNGTDKNDVILGKEGEDLLMGGKGNDFLKGGTEENELRGGQGDDFLLGGLDYDELKGESGNDLLSAGAGDDDLYGGTGINQLFGGKGDDYLKNNKGLSDGGAGFDIAHITHSYKEYELLIPKNVAPDDTLLLKNKVTGDTLVVKNIEEFEFSDGYFSQEELIQQIGVKALTPTTPPTVPTGGAVLSLTPVQERALQTITGVSGEVIDADQSGTLTKGDYLSLQGTQRVLTATDVESILAAQAPTVALTPIQTKALKELTRLTSFQVNDTDLSGTLSEGDKIVATNGLIKTVTAADIKAIEKKLTLSPDQKENITKGITSLNGEKLTISDEDGSGKVSAGDIVTTLHRHAFFIDPVPVRNTLTAENAQQINGEYGKPLSTKKIDIAILTDVLNLNAGKEYISLVLDKNGSGTLSVGDKVLINPRDNTFTPFPTAYPIFPSTYHTLTEKDLTAVNNLLAFQGAPLNLTEGQKDKITTITGFANFKVEDADLSKSLSENDRVISETTQQRFKLTAKNVNSIEKALTLTQQQQDNMTTEFKGVNGANVTISDEDGSGEVSAGDILSTRYLSIGRAFLTASGRQKLIPFTHVLREGDAHYINGTGTPLKNTATDNLSNLGKILQLQTFLEYPKQILDIDGSGKLSVGDIVVVGSNAFVGANQIHRPRFPASYRTLTQENIDALKA